jgi:hypothetical protein
MLVLTVIDGKPVGVMVVVVDSEEGSTSVLEDGVSGMGVTGSSQLDGKDDGIRIGRSERVMAMGGVCALATRMSGCHAIV